MVGSPAPAGSVAIEVVADLTKLHSGIDKGKADVLAAANSMASDLTKVETKATSTAKAVDVLAAATGREAAAEDRASQSRERAAAAVARREAAAQREAKALAEGARLQREVPAAQALYGATSERAAAAQAALAAAEERVAAAHGKGAAAARGAAAANDNLGKSSQVATHHLVNLGHQISDIGVSLAGGQNPFLVMIQQGAQIAPILGETGVSGAVRGIGSAVARFVTPAVATMGLLTGAVVLG